MRVIIAGSRGILDYNLIEEAVKESGFKITEVVSGVASGVDSLGIEWAKKNHISYVKFPAEWSRLGKSAGFKRNLDMGRHADALIAIWDGESSGTKHMIEVARKFKLRTYIKQINGD